MSRSTRARGEITFNPPLSREELDGHFHFVPVGGGQGEHERQAWLKVDEGDVVGIRPSQGDEMDFYNLADHVDDIVEAFCLLPDGRTERKFSGEIRVMGEDTGEGTPDVWRVVVVNGYAEEQRPKLVWPDGTEESC